MAQPKHMFIGLTEVAGYYRNLTEGLLELGVDVTFVDLSGNPYSYKDDLPKPGWIAAIEKLLRKVRGRTGIGITPRKVAWAASRAVLKVPVAVWALANCDVFVFGFRTHFAAHHELRLLRLLGKKSVFIFHGSDTRPPYLSGRHVPQTGEIEGRRLAARAQRMRRAVSRIERRADVIVNHPPSAQFHERPYLPWLWLGIPYPPLPAAPPLHLEGNKLRIVHAPTSPASKGTPLIRRAVEEVRRGGVEVQYVELVGRPNAEVIEAIAAADIVVDEAYSDSPMASLATEAASLGRAAVVGGHDLPLVVALAPSGRVPPTMTCRPDQLTQAIQQFVNEPGLRASLGAEAREFVVQNWAPRAVAARLLTAIAGEVSPDELQDAHPNPYLHGWGLPADQVHRAIRAVVASGGPQALAIPNEETTAALVEFAESSHQPAAE